jgi:hypothetical protein
MRIDVTRQEFQAIIDSLGGQLTKSQFKLVIELRKRLQWQFKGDGPNDPKRSWAPIQKRSVIRGPQLDAHIRPEKKTHWSFHKPRPKQPTKAKQPKPPMSAKDILDLI